MAKNNHLTSENKKSEIIQKEYDEFVYAVSHDFQAPLRHIKNFLHLLFEDKENLSEEEQQYLKHINEAVDKAYAMQSALLKLSRIKTDPETWTDIDLHDIACKAIKHNDQGAQFKIQSKLPQIKGDSELISTLLRLLFDNALKFHDKNSNIKSITISSEKSATEYLFAIQDNGIGIDPKFEDDIFKIFRQLHPNDFDGIGYGLTIAKKIIELHNGHIWLDTDNKKEEGTTIRFSLPQ